MALRGTAARRYAEAAFAIADRDGTIEDWLDALDRAAEALRDEEAVRLLRNPAIPMTERHDALEAALAKRVDQKVLNLLLLLLRRNRIDLLDRVAAEYRRLYNQREGIVTATATSAAPLEKDEERALVQRLEQMTGARVELTTDVDPTILGGVVVRVGDRLIDGSVRGRLERLRIQLASGAL